MIPANGGITMLDIAADRASYPNLDTLRYEQLAGIVQGENYRPAVELMRFMTPFGVGHFSSDDDSVSARRRPVYVDGWAKEVTWTQDVTDLLSLFREEVYVGVFIDTWTPEGYKVDVALSFTESGLRCDKMPKLHVEPLINTNYYLGQKHPDIFSRQDVKIQFSIPRKANNVRLKYIATGHGGHSGGDELSPQKTYSPWTEKKCFVSRRGVPTVPPSGDSIPPPVYGFRSAHRLLSREDGKEK